VRFSQSDINISFLKSKHKTLRLSERFYLLSPRRIWNLVRYFVYPSCGEQRARLVRMTMFGGEQRARLVRMTMFGGEQRKRFVRMTVFGGEQRARLVRMTMFGGEQRARFVRMTYVLNFIKTLRLSERFYLLFPRRIWNFVRYFVYPSYGEQRERLVRMTVFSVFLRHSLYFSLEESGTL